MKLEGKVALITGAGSGLGREAAQLFASEGAKVAVVDIDPERAKGTVALVEKNGGSAVAITADVRIEQQVIDAVAATLAAFGKLDIAWANAGIVSRGGVPSVAGGEQVEFQDLTDADWQDVVGVNLSGVFYTAKAAVPALRANGGGVILATSSAASFVAYHSIAAYSATKAGVNGMVRGLSLDLGKYGIRVNAIAPTHGMSPNFLAPAGAPVVGQSYEQVAGPWDPEVSPIPLKLNRPPSLSDNARAALFLVSDDSAYISGVTLPTTDGGTLSRVAMMFPEDGNNPPPHRHRRGVTVMTAHDNAPRNGPRRLVVDRSVCAGHGVCYGHSPEVVDCDDSGFPVILQDPLEFDQHITAAEEAAVMCPERAMTLESL